MIIKLKPLIPWLILSSLLHLILLFWGTYQDLNHSIKYTDIDYNVFNDAINCLLYPLIHTTATAAAVGGGEGGERRGEGAIECSLGEGYFNLLNPLFKFGNPYSRETYRYSPLLSLLLSPNGLIHISFGKILFSLFDLWIGILLFKVMVLRVRGRGRGRRGGRVVGNDSDSNREEGKIEAKIVGIIWLINPIIINISTRGSSESTLGFLIVSLLSLAERRKLNIMAIIFGLAVHFKLYPIIYGSTLLSFLSSNERRWFSISRNHIKFGLISFITFMSLNLFMYALWGQPFLENTFLYHITRLDHRHNFSPYFYSFYLSSSTSPPLSLSPSSSLTAILYTLIRNPLAAFLPQMGLSILSGFLLGGRDIWLAAFVQTWIFVAFNKVCTSQYFLWYLWLLPPLLPNLKMSKRTGILLVSSWVLGQAIWLSQAYKLEMLGESNFFNVWAAGVLFFGINCGVLVLVLENYQVVGLDAIGGIELVLEGKGRGSGSGKVKFN